MTIEAAVGSVLATWAVARAWWNRLAPIVTPIVKEAEALAMAGKIDKDARKKWVMDTLAICQTNNLVKLNFIEKAIIGKVVDVVAKKLPDFDISQQLKAGLGK